MELKRHQQRTCPTCDGEGEVKDAHEGYTSVSNDEMITDDCEHCTEQADGGHGHECPTCEGTGNGPNGEDFGCETCDGEGYSECKECDGKGYTTQCCPYCQDELIVEYYHAKTFATDGGELICSGCARDAGAFKCETCDGEGELPHESTSIGDKTFPTVGAECSCCGASPIRADDAARTCVGWRNEKNGFDHFVYRARMCDSDGIYFSYLCGDENGIGCLSEVLEQQKRVPQDRKDKLNTLSPLLDGDDDGLWAEMGDPSI